jgi:PAS domain S-box-containing protein
VLDGNGEVEFLVFSLEDVTKSTRTEQRMRFVNTIQTLFTTRSTRKDYLDAVVQELHQWTGCDKVGIRVVNHQGEAPYEAQVGFDPAFLEQEGRLKLNEECICARVIRRRLAWKPDVVTAGGSFRCDNTAEWARNITPELEGRYRGHCIACGYASLAVIPVWYLDEAVAAIHLADPRAGLVPPAQVAFLESLAPLIGEAIHRFNVEEALHKALRYARGLIETSLDPMVTISPNGEITDANRATEEVTGVLREKMIGSDFSEYFAEPDRAREGYQRVLVEGEVRDYPLTIRHVSGATTPVLYNAVVYRDDRNEVRGVFAAARDVTQLLEAQQEAHLRQQQLVQADKMVSLGILVSGVAHEINNPNYFIRSNAEVLRDVWKDAMPLLNDYYEQNGDFLLGGLDYSDLRDRIARLCEDVVGGSVRIQSIVNELRDFARLDPEDRMENLNVVDAIASATTLLANMLRKSTKHFSFSHEDGLPPVRGNYQRIEQVFINLLQNACQALPDPTRGIAVTVRLDGESNRVVAMVCDEGSGISEESLAHIMDPFFTTKRDSSGMGLGLSIAATIVREHHGTIEFISKVGEGTTAVVAFPAVLQAHESRG